MKLPSGRVGRDTLLLAGGLLGIAHETLIQAKERPSLLTLFAGMIGLPVFLSKDAKRNDPPPPAVEPPQLPPPPAPPVLQPPRPRKKQPAKKVPARKAPAKKAPRKRT